MISIVLEIAWSAKLFIVQVLGKGEFVLFSNSINDNATGAETSYLKFISRYVDSQMMYPRWGNFSFVFTLVSWLKFIYGSIFYVCKKKAQSCFALIARSPHMMIPWLSVPVASARTHFKCKNCVTRILCTGHIHVR